MLLSDPHALPSFAPAGTFTRRAPCVFGPAVSWRGPPMLALVVALAACDGPRPDAIPPAATASPDDAHDAPASPATSDRDSKVANEPHSPASTRDRDAAGLAPAGTGAGIPAGASILRSTRDVLVRPSRDADAPLIGIIARARSFVAWDLADGPGCKGQWARLEHGGHACLAAIAPSDEPVASLPILPGDSLVPFTYVEARDDDKPLPVWRSVHALLRGDPPMIEHAGNSRLAFESTKVFRSVGRVFLDDRGRAISRDLVRVLQPSTFEGRDLAVSPPPNDGELGWMLDTVELREAPRDTARATGTIRRHAEITANPDGTEPSDADANGWRFVRGHDDAGRAVEGWVPPKHLRVWSPPPALDDIAADEIWVDVESSTQLLTLMRGSKPLFATLVSTGKAGDRTPPGVYRIRMKHAWGTMRSLPGADEPYRVEGVPWAQYFHQRYALHGVYWHNGFGRPASHGCVNLSPKDARRVFEATSPSIPGGWRSVHETPEHIGTVIRVRRGDAPTPDRRKELVRVDADAAPDAAADGESASSE